MASKLRTPEGYSPILTVKETEKAIPMIKDFFRTNLAFELNLQRVTAPLLIESGTGINDDLNGIEKPVSFSVKDIPKTIEVPQSLAKWKRMMLADLGFVVGEGLYADMNAIRPDEDLDNTHSLYVDQWDWERVISVEQRKLDFLFWIVKRIYDVVRRTELYMCHEFSALKPVLPEEITFIHTEELATKYPDLTPKEREDKACKEHGAIFLVGMGADLKDGKPHDGRAPDYDDWSSPNSEGFCGLNGDIVVYNPVFDASFEISSMGIRVDKAALEKQLEIRGCPERRELYFHKRLLEGSLPLSIGGGIGQSRLCMFFLRKAHIGEIQSSLWPSEMREKCSKAGIQLL